LKNIIIRIKGGGNKELAGKELDEKIDSYPEGLMWGPMPVSVWVAQNRWVMLIAAFGILVGELQLGKPT